MSSGNLGSPVRHLGGIHHGLGDVPVDLDAHGGLLLEGVHLGNGLGGIADESVGGNEFGIDHVGALLAAEHPERHVRHVLHRSEKHGAFPKVQIPYFHWMQI